MQTSKPPVSPPAKVDLVPAEPPKENIWAKRKEERQKTEKTQDEGEGPGQSGQDGSAQATPPPSTGKSVTVSVERTMNKSSDTEREERLQRPAGFGRGARKGGVSSRFRVVRSAQTNALFKNLPRFH